MTENSVVCNDPLCEIECDTCSSCECYCDCDYPDEYNDDDGLTDAEADAMTLSSAGWGTDEDYGYYGEDEF